MISQCDTLWTSLAPFLRYGNILAKNCLFFLLLSHLPTFFPMFPLEFCTEVNNEETRAMGLSSTEDRIIEAGDDQSISRVLT